MLTYDEKALSKRLRRLDRHRKTVFAVSCAQRLVPFFERYSDAAALPEQLDRLSAIVNATWSWVDGGAGLDPAMVDEAAAMVPDWDDGWIPEMGYADNAAAAVAYAVSTSLTGEVQDAVWAARQIYDVMDYAMQMRHANHDASRPLTERPSLESPIVQESVVAIYASLNDVERGKESLKILRSRAIEDGKRWVAELT